MMLLNYLVELQKNCIHLKIYLFRPVTENLKDIL